MKSAHGIQLEAGQKGNIRKAKDRLFVKYKCISLISCANYFSKLQDLDCHVSRPFEIFSKDPDAAREYNDDEDKHNEDEDNHNKNEDDHNND
ncbi:hypothetical protein MUCCIDRAFT_113807 [Mucor lusitanicus CBS 277.49]|uniref:Uncharacterized protein n=1 Tax=Mucor lusitanicus CBS 277.49 TaxID=747725 RepID=A0A162QKV7_MUCCL|nr:hypothetical protein MUCCIDRAFT_113807 [Mucor lusitanicus CBS 277.49]